MLLSFIGNIFLALLIFFSITSLGFISNKKIFYISTQNFYENFICGVFIILFYLKIHYFFIKIDLKSTFHLLLILFLSLIYCLKFIRFEKKIIFLFILTALLIMNSDRFPYYDYIFDFGYYHNGYINWLNQSNIVLGLANLHPSYGYTGNSYLLGSFLNFYPLLERGYIYTTSIFFLFYIFFIFYEIKKIQDLFQKFFLIFSLYVILKFIFEEPLGDYAPYKINLILFFYIFYKFLHFLNNENSTKQDFIIIIFTISILITLSPLSWFLSVMLVIYLLTKRPNFFIDKNTIFCIFFIILFFVINFLKSGHILYPLQINIFAAEFAVKNDFLYHIKNFPKDYLPGLEWVSPWFKSKFLTNSFCLIYGFLFFLVISLTILKDVNKNKNFRNFLKLFSIINILLLFWFFNSPDIKTGKVIFWTGIVITSSFLYSVWSKKIDIFLRKFIFIKNPHLIIISFIFLVSLFSSMDNLIILKTKTYKQDIINNFPTEKIFKLNNDYNLELKYLDYTNNKFTTTNENSDLEKIKVQNTFFKKIFIDN